jgi:DNA-binding beta-propeller fold protein YncE
METVSMQVTKLKLYAAIVLTLCAIFVLNVGAQNKKKVVTEYLDRVDKKDVYVNRQLPMVHMKGYLQLVETIPMPGEGYYDQGTYDIKTMRQFISGEDDNTLITVDMKAGKVIHVTKLPGSPRRAFFVPNTNEVWVDLGQGENTVVAVDGTTLEIVKTVELTDGKGANNRDADNGAFDYAKGLFYISATYASLGTCRVPGPGPCAPASIMDVVDTKTAKLVGTITLKGLEPQGVVIEPNGKRLYVGMGDMVNGESWVNVIDTEKRQVIATWTATGAPQIHIGGLDPTHRRLFMGGRQKGGHGGEPDKLAVMDADTGKVIQVLDAPGGIDEILYDEASKRIYVAGTTGTVGVYHQDDPDHYQLLGLFPVGPNAKTGIWIPELKRYYAAVPKFMSKPLTPMRPMTDEWIVKDAHLEVFEAIP